MRQLAAILLLNAAAMGADNVSAQDARRGPAFLDQATIYQIWLRSFTPEGTLKAAAVRLPHIATLGAAIVYLSPIHVQSQVGGFSNPYRMKDYYHVDPEYGTEQDLMDFCAAAHQLGLKVLRPRFSASSRSAVPTGALNGIRPICEFPMTTPPTNWCVPPYRDGWGL
jgi:Alpha amylase, catalytic domain